MLRSLHAIPRAHRSAHFHHLPGDATAQWMRGLRAKYMLSLREKGGEARTAQGSCAFIGMINAEPPDIFDLREQAHTPDSPHRPSYKQE
jgi:hypothetical protein